MQGNATTEVAIFEQIHSLLEQQRQGKRRAPSGAPPAEEAQRLEARAGRRRPYHCAQLLAPMKGNNPPAQTDFTLVQCRDISPGGFSYFTSIRPKGTQVVVALGLAPFAFFVAEIVHVQNPDDGADDQLLVGCRFLHRLESAAR